MSFLRKRLPKQQLKKKNLWRQWQERFLKGPELGGALQLTPKRSSPAGLHSHGASPGSPEKSPPPAAAQGLHVPTRAGTEEKRSEDIPRIQKTGRRCFLLISFKGKHALGKLLVRPEPFSDAWSENAVWNPTRLNHILRSPWSTWLFTQHRWPCCLCDAEGNWLQPGRSAPT